jgi:hypothetical protein
MKPLLKDLRNREQLWEQIVIFPWYPPTYVTFSIYLPSCIMKVTRIRCININSKAKREGIYG